MKGFEPSQGDLLFLIRADPECKSSGITPLGWRTYARHSNRYIRVALATRADCPSEILMYLLEDSDPAVVAAAVCNPNTPPTWTRFTLLKSLGTDKMSVVWQFAPNSPHLTWLEKLLARWCERQRIAHIYGRNRIFWGWQRKFLLFIQRLLIPKK